MRFAGRIVCLCLLAIASMRPAVAEDYRPSATQVKAALMYQVAKYVEWPNGFTVDSDANFIYGILGDNPFQGALSTILEGKQTIGGKSLVLKHFSRMEDVTPVQVLFISSSESQHLEDVLRSVSRIPVLTVGDTPGYAERGVMINFILTNENQVRFEINEHAISQAHLQISTALTSLATRVIR